MGQNTFSLAPKALIVMQAQCLWSKGGQRGGMTKNKRQNETLSHCKWYCARVLATYRIFEYSSVSTLFTSAETCCNKKLFRSCFSLTYITRRNSSLVSGQAGQCNKASNKCWDDESQGIRLDFY